MDIHSWVKKWKNLPKDKLMKALTAVGVVGVGTALFVKRDKFKNVVNKIKEHFDINCDSSQMAETMQRVQGTREGQDIFQKLCKRRLGLIPPNSKFCFKALGGF